MSTKKMVIGSLLIDELGFGEMEVLNEFYFFKLMELLIMGRVG
jgi:hypothetical protein